MKWAPTKLNSTEIQRAQESRKNGQNSFKLKRNCRPLRLSFNFDLEIYNGGKKIALKIVATPMVVFFPMNRYLWYPKINLWRKGRWSQVSHNNVFSLFLYTNATIGFTWEKIKESKLDQWQIWNIHNKTPYVWFFQRCCHFSTWLQGGFGTVLPNSWCVIWSMEIHFQTNIIERRWSALKLPTWYQIEGISYK